MALSSRKECGASHRNESNRRNPAGLFVLPVLVSGCLPDPRGGVPWYEARRDPSGLAPDPAETPEAVIQVFTARAVSWRGVFAVHTWIAVKPSGAPRYTRYEVVGFGVASLDGI